MIHWRGGQHLEVRVRKPQPGEHLMRNPVEVDDVIRQMGARWSDEHIAATLNRMGSTTPFGHTWSCETRRRLPSHQRHPGLRIRHQGRTMPDHGRSRGEGRRELPRGPRLDSQRDLAREAIRLRCSVADPRRRPRTTGGAAGATPPSQARRPPVANFSRRSHAQDSGHLKKGCTMKRRRLQCEARPRCDCCREECERRRESA